MPSSDTFSAADRVHALEAALVALGVEFDDDHQANVRLHGPEAITGDQVWAARQLLGLTADRLAMLAKVPETSVLIFEKTSRMPQPKFPGRRNRVEALRAALISAGVEFADGKPNGVRMRKGAGT